MTDSKFTDDEIIKALECCLSGNVNKSAVEICSPCPFFHDGNCTDLLKQNALALINRQKAEIERLRKYNIDVAFKHYNDGIKEFAERLKKRTRMPLGTLYGEMVYLKDIDTLVKEMTEENK